MWVPRIVLVRGAAIPVFALFLANFGYILLKTSDDSQIGMVRWYHLTRNLAQYTPKPEFCLVDGQCDPEPYFGCPYTSFLSFPQCELVSESMAGEARIRQMLSSNRTPVVLHIGPSDLSLADEVQRYQDLFASIPSWPHAAVRLVFIEPDEGKHILLQQNLDLIGGKSEISKVAIKGNSADSLKIYRFHDQLEKDRWLWKSMYQSWASVFEDRLLDTYVAFHNGVPEQYRPYLAPQTVRLNINFSDVSIEQLRPYVERVSVDPLSVAEALTALKVTPDQIAMVTIDAEGLDPDIAAAFLELDFFKPFIFQWEIHDRCEKLMFNSASVVRTNSPKYKQVTRMMYKRGYSVCRDGLWDLRGVLDASPH